MILQLILFSIIVLLITTAFYINISKPHGTPPGTTGLPIIGTLPPRNKPFGEFIDSYIKKFGDIFWLRMGTRNFVVLCHPNDITEAYKNPALTGRIYSYSSKLFYKYGHTDTKSQESFFTNSITGLINSEGETWKNVRRFALRRLRDGGMGKSSIQDIILDEADALVKDFEKYVGKPIDLPWSINASILNVVWKIVGDKRYEVNDKEIQHLCNNLNDALEISQNDFFMFDMIPWLFRFVPNFIMKYFHQGEYEYKMGEVYKLLHSAIADHKKTLDVDNPRDLIDSYLVELENIKNESNVSENCQTFCENELANTLCDLFIAGSETTSSTTRWFIFYMIKHPEIQERIQMEIDSVVPRDRRVALDDRDRLPYFEASFHEALRLKSILPVGLAHVAIEDTKIKDYVIPKGTHFIANLQGLHRNPKYWEKPEEFYPQHFIKSDGTFDSKKEGFLPFSTGRRVCVGENLAKMDLYFILATLLQNFTFSKPEGEILDDDFHSDQPFFTFLRSFKIIINKRT